MDMLQPKYLPPLGPGNQNVFNLDGSTLTYYQKGSRELTATAINTVYNGLLNSAGVHETSLEEFTREIDRCLFWVQAYDNSKFIGFACVRRIEWDDLRTLGLLVDGFGSDPFGLSPFGGTDYPDPKNVLGEVAYVYEDPAYRSDIVAAQCFVFALQVQADFRRRLLFCMPDTLQESDPLFEVNEFLSQFESNDDGSDTLLKPLTTPYHNIEGSYNLYNFTGLENVYYGSANN